MTASRDRIVIETEEVRRTAARMRGGALLLSSAGRQLAGRDLPSMPASVASLVTEVIYRANSELQDVAAELITDAGTLTARATWAELGGGDEVAWLIPGLSPFPALRPTPESPSHPVPRVTDKQIRQSSEWAVQLLDRMHDSMQRVEIDRLGTAEADEVLVPEVVPLVDEYADEVPVRALGNLTLTADAALDFEHWEHGSIEAGARAGATAASGALATGLSTLSFAPTGPGILGCLLVGGAAGSAGRRHLGDEAFDD